MAIKIKRRADILGVFSLDVGAITPFLYTFREREDIIDLFEMASGQR